MKRFQAADANTLPNYSSQAEADPPNAQVLGPIPPAPSYPLQAAPRSSTASRCGTLCQAHGAAPGLLSPGEAFPPCLPCGAAALPQHLHPCSSGGQLQNQGHAAGPGSVLPAAAQAAEHGSHLTMQLSSVGKSSGSTSLQCYASIARVNSFLGAK